jgi:sulfate transporter 4
VDCAAVTHIDGSAVQVLKQLHEEYKSRNIQVSLFCEAAVIPETVLNVFQCAKSCVLEADAIVKNLLQIAFANPNHQVMSILTRSRLPDIMGREWFFVRMHDAVQSCLSHMQTNQVEVNIDDGEAQEQPFRSETQSAASNQSSVTVPLLSGHNPNV